MKLFNTAVTLTNTLPAYSSGDQIGSLQEIEFFPRELDLAELCSVTVVDKAKQKAAIDLLFFNENITVASTDNAAADVTDAQMAANCLGKISVAGADYVDLANSSVATVGNLKTILKNSSAYKAKQKKLYMLVVSRGTPTYTSTSDLTIRLGARHTGA